MAGSREVVAVRWHVWRVWRYPGPKIEPWVRQKVVRWDLKVRRRW